MKNKFSHSLVNRDGFTLLEVLIATAIFTVGILGIIGMFVTTTRGNLQGKRMTEATSLAQSRLDFLLTNAVYNNLVATYDGVVENKLKSSGETAAANEAGPYTRTTEINAVSGLDALEIVVTVSWVSHQFVDSSGVTQNYSKKVTLKAIRAKD